MHLNHKNKVQNVLNTPSGEIIYELIGLGKESGENPGHSLAQIIIPSGKSSPLHYHKQSEETYYILDGTATMEINGKEFTLSAGETLLISAGEQHRITNQEPGDLEFLAVCVPAWEPGDSYLVE